MIQGGYGVMKWFRREGIEDGSDDQGNTWLSRLMPPMNPTVPEPAAPQPAGSRQRSLQIHLHHRRWGVRCGALSGAPFINGSFLEPGLIKGYNRRSTQYELVGLAREVSLLRFALLRLEMSNITVIHVKPGLCAKRGG